MNMPTTKKQTVSETMMMRFTLLLDEKMGLHYPKNMWPDLEKKLEPLMVEMGFEDMNDYVKMLLESNLQKDEITALAYYLTIGETYFFRDAKLFAALENQILPDLMDHKKNKTLRIWSAGCCTGEEPYSLAILLQHLVPDLKYWQIDILGTDINEEFLAKARQAMYRKWSFRATPKEILKKCFVHLKNDFYKLRPDIQKMVHFRYQNLVEGNGNHDEGFGECDLILCNNVLIYFSEKQIEKTIDKFARSLSENGCLVVTAIEAPYVNHPQLHPYCLGGSYVFRKENRAPLREHKRPPRPKSAQHENETVFQVVLPAFLNLPNSVLEYRFPTKQEIARTLLKPVMRASGVVEEKATRVEKPQINFLELYRQKEYAAVVEELEKHLAPHKLKKSLRQHLDKVVLLIRGYANQGKLAEALEWCGLAINQEKLDPVLHYLQAEIHETLGNTAESIKALKRTLFLDTEFAIAHYLMGMLELQNNNAQIAHREFKTTLLLIDKAQPEDILPGTEEVTVGYVKDHIYTIMRIGK